MRISLAALAFALGASAAGADTITYFIGDIDGFGGATYTDNRSAAEIAATNGAQWTDLRDDYRGYNPYTDDDFPLPITFMIDNFSGITSMTLDIYAFGIQSNDNDPLSTIQAEDAISFEGSLLDGFFQGVDQGTSGEGLISGSIAPALFANALDGVAEFTILLNSAQGTSAFPLGEPAAFDYFALTVEGTLAPAAVPLPASLPLMVLGLGGLAAIGRRRRRAA